MAICPYCSDLIVEGWGTCSKHFELRHGAHKGVKIISPATPELKGIHRQQERLRDLLFRHVHVDDHLLPNTEFIRAVMDRHLADRDVHLGDPNE